MISFYFMLRISVIFRVRSAKAVKITDMDLIKRLGAIVGMFILFLIVRTLVSPPKGKLSGHVINLINPIHPSYYRGDRGQSQGIFVRKQLVGPCFHNKYVLLTGGNSIGNFPRTFLQQKSCEIQSCITWMKKSKQNRDFILFSFLLLGKVFLLKM